MKSFEFSEDEINEEGVCNTNEEELTEMIQT